MYHRNIIYKNIQQLLREPNNDEEVTKILKDKQTKNETEVREWIEKKMGKRFVSDNIIEELKNGVVLCKYVLAGGLPSVYCARVRRAERAD